MSEIEEVAKAAAEASKFGTRALETTEKLASFVAKVFKEPVRDAVGIIGDRLKFMRWERQVRLANRVNEILNQRGVTETRAVSPKLALPIFENASLEDNNELQDLWVKLLVNSMDPNFTEEVRLAFLEIIKGLNPLDVAILNCLYNLSSTKGKRDWDIVTNRIFGNDDICRELSISSQDYWVSIYNLFRVQCLAPASEKSRASVIGVPWSAYQGVDGVFITPLGKSFVEACIK